MCISVYNGHNEASKTEPFYPKIWDKFSSRNWLSNTNRVINTGCGKTCVRYIAFVRRHNVLALSKNKAYSDTSAAVSDHYKPNLPLLEPTYAYASSRARSKNNSDGIENRGESATIHNSRHLVYLHPDSARKKETRRNHAVKMRIAPRRKIIREKRSPIYTILSECRCMHRGRGCPHRANREWANAKTQRRSPARTASSPYSRHDLPGRAKEKKKIISMETTSRVCGQVIHWKGLQGGLRFFPKPGLCRIASFPMTLID